MVVRLAVGKARSLCGSSGHMRSIPAAVELRLAQRALLVLELHCRLRSQLVNRRHVLDARSQLQLLQAWWCDGMP